MIPVVNKKTGLKIAELKSLFKRLPQLSEEEQERFEKDVEQIHLEMKSEPDLWD